MDTTTAHQMGLVPSVSQCIKNAEGSAELIKERIPRLRSRIAKRQSERSLEFFEAVAYHLKRLQKLDGKTTSNDK